MNSLVLTRPSTPKQFPENLNLLIDETRLVQSINRSKKLAMELKVKNPLSNRLSFIEKDIVNMEAELKLAYNKFS